jgi:hypothetical protein
MVCTLVNPFGFLDAHPTVADGVLVGLSLGRIHVQRGRQKTSTKQTAPLTNGCREILARVRDERKKMKIQALVNPFVFQRDDGKPLTGPMIQAAMRKACKKAPLSDPNNGRRSRTGGNVKMY